MIGVIGGAAGYRPRVQTAYCVYVYRHSSEEQIQYRIDPAALEDAILRSGRLSNDAKIGNVRGDLFVGVRQLITI